MLFYCSLSGLRNDQNHHCSIQHHYLLYMYHNYSTEWYQDRQGAVLKLNAKKRPIKAYEQHTQHTNGISLNVGINHTLWVIYDDCWVASIASSMAAVPESILNYIWMWLACLLSASDCQHSSAIISVILGNFFLKFAHLKALRLIASIDFMCSDL